MSAAGGPLAGRTIVITRDEARAASLQAELAARGAVPVLCPVVAIGPPESWTEVDGALALRSLPLASPSRVVSIVANMWRGFPGMAHTGAARAGVVNLTRSLALVTDGEPGSAWIDADDDSAVIVSGGECRVVGRRWPGGTGSSGWCSRRPTR